MASMWGVSSGSYSDYRVDCMCPSKELAEAVAEKMGPDYSAEEFPFITSLDDVFSRVHYKVVVDGEGREVVKERWSYVEAGFTPLAEYVNQAMPHYYHKGQVTGLSVRGWDQALKAARDKLGQLKAEREGIAS